MQKELSITINNDTYTLKELGCTPKDFSKILHEIAMTPPPTEETYAELPILEAQDNQDPISNKIEEQQAATTSESQPSNPAIQTTSWTSTAFSFPSKVISALNPLNWLPGKNSANPEQSKIIVEEKDLNSEANSDKNKTPDQENSSSSDWDKLTPDDSPFTEESGNNEGTTLTGNNSDLADTQ